jgi:hypothetical protein
LCRCAAGGTVSEAFGNVTGAFVLSSDESSVVAVIGSDAGLYQAKWLTSSLDPVLGVIADIAVTAVAFRPQAPPAESLYGEVFAVGSVEKLYLFSDGLSVLRWEWATDYAQANGGAVDAAITGLAYDSCGALWITNAVSVNVMALNGSFFRIDGVSGLHGNNTVAVAADADIPGSVWVASPTGLFRYAPGVSSGRSDLPYGSCYEAVGSTRGDFKFYAGFRYLPSNNVYAVASRGDSGLALVDGGLVVIHHQVGTFPK